MVALFKPRKEPTPTPGRPAQFPPEPNPIFYNPGRINVTIPPIISVPKPEPPDPELAKAVLFHTVAVTFFWAVSGFLTLYLTSPPRATEYSTGTLDDQARNLRALPAMSGNDSRLAGIGRQRRDASTPVGIGACPGFRPFVCYSFDERAQDYPPWLQTTDTQKEADKCSSCNVAAVTECYDETLYFPFNLCTREMLASGLCEGKSLDPKGSPPYYALRRALSGPYASLKSEEETIDLWQSLKVPETPAEQTSVDKEKAEAQHADRVKRQSSTLPAVSYPRCIKTDGLPADQKAIVEADELLDCDRNPFYKELGHESLTVTKLPLCTEVDPNQKFCRTSADSQSTKPTATTPAAEGFLDRLTVPEPWDLVSFVLACIGNTLMVIAIALAWYIRFGRPEKDDDDDDDEEMDSHSRKHDSSKKKTGDDDDA
ncbi:unnamed protein product, partial [Mesorhabditis spiculigera]